MRDAETHNAIGGAEVESIRGFNIGRGTKTDSNGTYRMDGLLAGVMIVQASANGYSSQSIPVSLSGNQTVNFDLTSLQSIRYRYFGVVRDGVGSPVPATTLRSGNGNCEFSATTDATGHYDSTSNCNSLVFDVRPPNGYEGVLPQFQSLSPAGERNLTTKRILSVTLAAPSQIPKSDGTLFFSVRVSVRFDDGTTRRLGSQDFVDAPIEQHDHRENSGSRWQQSDD